MINPKFYRASKGNWISWEIYSWKNFFIAFSPGTLEIQINRWPKDQREPDF